MIFLLNYMPWVVVALITWAAFKSLDKPRRFWGVIAGGTVVLLMLAALQPSYLPKGQPQRTQLEQFEAEELEMQDSLRAPALDAKAREERFHGTFNAVEEIRRKKTEEQQ